MLNLCRNLLLIISLGLIVIGSASTASVSMVFPDWDTELLFGAAPSAGQLTISAASGGEVHFLQLFYYNSSSCASSALMANGVADLTNNFVGFTLPSLPQKYRFNLNGTSIYNLIFNRGFTTGDMSTIGCIGVSLTGGNDSTNGINCTYFNDITCDNTTSECASSLNQSVNWTTTTPTPCVTPKNLYISNNAANNVYACPINSDGTLGNCVQTGPSGSSLAASLTLGNIVNNGYAYFSSGATTTSIVVKCSLNPASSGALSNCATTTSAAITSSLNGAKGIAFSSYNNGINSRVYAYIATNNTSLAQCTVTTSQSGNGELSGCSSLPLAGGSVSLSTPIDLVINDNYIYVTNNTGGIGTGSISICQIVSGNLSCSTGTTTHVVNPKGIAINNGYIYFVNNSVNSIDGAVASCQITTGGALTNCVNTGALTSEFNTPQAIAIYNGYAYISNNGSSGSNKNTITLCTISSPGQLSSCGPLSLTNASGGSLTLSTPTGLSIY